MPSLPLVFPAHVCQFGLPIRLLEPDPQDGNVSLLELVILNHIIARRGPAIAFEFGTFDGRTTINFAANAPSTARIYTIDLPKSQVDDTKFDLDVHDRKYVEKSISGSRFLGSAEAPKIIQLLGDSANLDLTQWYGQVDLVFIDGSHTEPYVRNDTEIALSLIGPHEGVILWHDYDSSWPAVTSVLDEYQRSAGRLGNLTQIYGTSLAICEPNAPKIPTFAIGAEEIEDAQAYWSRYPDVAVNDAYGQRGRLGPLGARRHFEEFGRSEGRVWGR